MPRDLAEPLAGRDAGSQALLRDCVFSRARVAKGSERGAVYPTADVLGGSAWDWASGHSHGAGLALLCHVLPAQSPF